MTCTRGCCRSQRDHFASIRTIGETTRHHNRRDQALSRDLSAYKSLTEDGLEPCRIDGMHELMTKDASADIIEGRIPS